MWPHSWSKRGVRCFAIAINVFKDFKLMCSKHTKILFHKKKKSKCFHNAAVTASGQILHDTFWFNLVLSQGICEQMSTKTYFEKNISFPIKRLSAGSLKHF